ncbi:MAG TPA: DUF1697 domain-containing protein [Patescibacteria group bacterium]
MKYVALLRGINVGGKNKVKMSLLKSAFETCGFENVTTFINSGNIIFMSKEESIKLKIKIEELLSEKFFPIKVIILSEDTLGKIIENVPKLWNEDSSLRCYIAFISKPLKVDNVISEIQPNPGVDEVNSGEECIYLSTILSGITKSGFSKLSTKKIYKEITIRNFTTIKKLQQLMQIQK